MSSTTLWMGDVEPYWDENFIRGAFTASGETPTAVKMMKNRATGGQARYCFVDFQNAAMSERVVMAVNGKPVPNSSPPRLFKLNFAVFGMQAPPKPPGAMGLGGDKAGPYGGRKEFSLFIGELTPEVEDYALYTFFSRRYPSIKGAKVILDNTGISRGFGFVRFGSEDEQQTALTEMQGITGLGGRALRVSVATPKKPRVPEGGDTWSSGVGSWGSGGGGGTTSANTWNPDAGNSWNSPSAGGGGGGGGSWNSASQYGGGGGGGGGASQGWGSQASYQGNWESGNTWGGGSTGGQPQQQQQQQQQQQSSWGGSTGGGAASTGTQPNSWAGAGGQQGSWTGQDTWGGAGGASSSTNQGSWTSGGQQYGQYQGYQGQY